MLIVVRNGTLTEVEQSAYVRHAVRKYPASQIEKLILDIQGKTIKISYVLRRFRELRKMGGAVIGCPEDWNSAKQAEPRKSISDVFAPSPGRRRGTHRRDFWRRTQL